MAPPAHPHHTRARADAAGPGRLASPSGSGLGEVWVKNDAANPTHSFKDRVVGVAVAKARELGFETLACASTGNLANAVAAHAAAAGLDSYVFVPSDLEEQKLLATGVYGDQARRDQGQLRRRQPPLHPALRGAAVGVREREPAALLLGGLEDGRVRDREQLGWTLPDRVVCPIASGSLFTRIGRGFTEWLEVGLVEGELPAFTGAQAAGCSPVAEAYGEGWEICKPAAP